MEITKLATQLATHLSHPRMCFPPSEQFSADISIDWKHPHTNYNLLVWGPGCCFLQDLTLGKFPMLRLGYGTTYSWVLCSWFGGGTPMFFARWRLEPIVAVVVVVVAVQVRNPRRADAVALCLRINLYICIYEVHCCVRAWHESSSENRQSQTPPPELGKAHSWESEWLPTMGSHAGFLKMQPGTSPSTLAQKKSNGSQCVFPVAFFLQLEAQSVKKIGKKKTKNAK